MNIFVYDLIAKVLSGEATAEEATQLQDACVADPAVQKAFVDAKVLWTLTEKAMPSFQVDKAAAWQKVQSRIGMEEAVDFPEISPKTIRFVFPAWTRWAAAAVVAGLGVTLLLNQIPEKSQTIVATESRQSVTLPDGSRVTLGKNAQLLYAADFKENQKRHVSLQGEAFFEVAKDAAHPFTIDAQSLQVTVVGTSFLVNTKAQEVSVRSGKVQVRQDETAQEVFLTAGEGIQLSNGSFQKEMADSNDYFLKTGRIVFQAKPFEGIIHDISRILEVPVQFDASVPSAGRAQAVTYTTTAASAENVLTDLCRITGYQWRKEEGGYRIFQAR